MIFLARSVINGRPRGVKVKEGGAGGTGLQRSTGAALWQDADLDAGHAVLAAGSSICVIPLLQPPGVLRVKQNAGGDAELRQFGV
jgi:hypothetical protein